MFTGKWKILLLMILPPLCWGSQIPSIQDTVVLSKKCAEQYQLKHYNQAYYYCYPRARQQDPQAQYYVGMMSEQGVGTRLNHEVALKWFTLAADAGNAAAQLKLGKLYSAGIWTARDDGKAAHYYFLAAKQNVPEAQFLLALCYQLGIHLKKDENSALFWYTQAVKNGLKDALALPSDLKPKKFITQKSWPGNEEYQMALSLHQSKQTADKELFFDWLRSAAEKGHPQAQYEMGVHFENGLTQQDDGAALYWFEKAAKNHHPAAQSYLAWMTALGLGTPENLPKSLDWFLLSKR